MRFQLSGFYSRGPNNYLHYFIVIIKAPILLYSKSDEDQKTEVGCQLLTWLSKTILVKRPAAV